MRNTSGKIPIPHHIGLVLAVAVGRELARCARRVDRRVACATEREPGEAVAIDQPDAARAVPGLVAKGVVSRAVDDCHSFRILDINSLEQLGAGG